MSTENIAVSYGRRKRRARKRKRKWEKEGASARRLTSVTWINLARLTFLEIFWDVGSRAIQFSVSRKSGWAGRGLYVICISLCRPFFPSPYLCSFFRYIVLAGMISLPTFTYVCDKYFFRAAYISVLYAIPYRIYIVLFSI